MDAIQFQISIRDVRIFMNQVAEKVSIFWTSAVNAQQCYSYFIQQPALNSQQTQQLEI